MFIFYERTAVSGWIRSYHPNSSFFRHPFRHQTNNQVIANKNKFHSSNNLYLNRFLFDTSEVTHDTTSGHHNVPVVCISKEDYRTIHAAKILGLQNGDTIRGGIVSCTEYPDGLLTDDAIIQWLPEGKIKKAMPLADGSPPGSLQIQLQNLQPPIEKQKIYNIPPVSLLLALPRPLQLGRILPMIAQMGVDQLILTEARKVPKDYFGSHLFRKPEALTEKLIEGLCQSGDVRLPRIRIVRNLSIFLNDEVNELFPIDQYARVIAHPQRDTSIVEKRMRDVIFPNTESSLNQRRLLIAIGPEGGWEEPNELHRFQENGFQQITLGSRVLRSDCAVISLLALAHDACI